jgi:hypothetical protein
MGPLPLWVAHLLGLYRGEQRLPASPVVSFSVWAPFRLFARMERIYSQLQTLVGIESVVP